MYYELADTQIDLQDFSAAERSARLGLEMALQINGEDHVDAVRLRMMLGNALLGAGHSAEGLEQLGRAKRDVLRLVGPDDPFHTRAVLETYGSWQTDVGDIAEGIGDLRAVIANRLRLDDSPLNLSPSMRKIAKGLIELGRYEEAGKTVDEVAAIYEGNDQWKSGTPRYNGVTLLRVQLALAESRLDAAHELLGKLVYDSDPKNVGRADAAAAAGLRTINWLTEAQIALATDNIESNVQAQLAKARAEIESSRLVKDRELYLSSADLIEGESRLKRREPAAALPLLQRALKAREVLFVAPHPRLAEALTLLATCYLELGRVDESRELVARAAAIDAHYPQLSDRYRRPLRELQARLPARATRPSKSATRRSG
jgi:tetratricopeptide (TPR) repeat protein